MIVYRIFCRVTGKSYIGGTKQTLEARMQRHRTRANSGGRQMYPLYVDARQYGWEAFEVSVLNHARSIEELKVMERAAIVLYRTRVPVGYNQMTDGHDRPAPRVAGWNKGVPHTAETRAKMSAARVGGKNARARVFEYDGTLYRCMQDCCTATGLTRSQLYLRVKRGNAKYLTPPTPGDYGPPPYRHTAETKARMSAYRLAHSPRRRPIIVDGKTYPSIISAVGVSGYSRDQLKKQLKRGVATYADAAKEHTS